MKIFIDIGHPAHVHYFKHFIWEMQRKGHDFLISARNRGEIFRLLDFYGFPFFDRGSGSDSQFGKILYLPKADYRIFKIANRFKPDLFLSFGSMYAAHVSKLCGKPHITFDDTEFSKKEYYLYAPFTDVICTPYCFRRELGRKQIRFNGLMELCYLHPNRFEPDRSVLELLGVAQEEKYAVLRFVAFKAIHDSGVKGFSLEKKCQVVEKLGKYGKVFISSERKLPFELARYKISIPPQRLHDAIYFSSVYLGDSQTTTTEAACLGTPSIRCNSFACSNLERANFVELEGRYQLLHNYHVTDVDSAIEKAVELFQSGESKTVWKRRKERFFGEKIDVSAFLIWFVEDYPESAHTMRKNSSYQMRFK